MKKFVLTVLVLACTAAYADNDKNNGNGPPSKGNATAISGSQSISGATSQSLSGANATGGQSVAGATASTGNQTLTGGNSSSVSSSTTGPSVSGANATTGNQSLTGGNSTSSSTGGQAVSTSSGGNATGGHSSATGGSSTATGGNPIANGGNSTATGGNPTANGGTSTAIGGTTTANGGSSTTGPITTSVEVTIGTNANQTDKEIAAGHDKALVDAANAKIRNTPSMFGPALVSSNDTCMGSTSGSVATPGLGLSFGSTWVDENCKMLKNSERLWNMGLKAASIALLCTDEKIKESLEITGFPCPVRPPVPRTPAPN